MLAGSCRSTKKYFLKWFSVFCEKYEVIYACRWGQNTPKITVFSFFQYVIDVTEVFKLFILILLVKTQLLVPNLGLYDLAFEKNSLKKVDFSTIFTKNRDKELI